MISCSPSVITTRPRLIIETENGIIQRDISARDLRTEKFIFQEEFTPFLWFDASNINSLGLDIEQRVEYWRDSSINSFDAFQLEPSNRPLFNISVFSNRGAVEFDGFSSLLDLPGNNLNGEMSIFIVFKPRVLFSGSLGSGTRSALIVLNKDGLMTEISLQPNHIVPQFDASSNYPRNLYPVGSYQNKNILFTGFDGGTTGVVEQDYRIRLNFVELFKSGQSSNNFYSSSLSRIGERVGGSSITNFDGFIAEIIVFDYLLSEEEIIKIETYLYQKWIHK